MDYFVSYPSLARLLLTQHMLVSTGMGPGGTGLGVWWLWDCWKWKEGRERGREGRGQGKSLPLGLIFMDIKTKVDKLDIQISIRTILSTSCKLNF